jgi:hypothetical protein
LSFSKRADFRLALPPEKIDLLADDVRPVVLELLRHSILSEEKPRDVAPAACKCVPPRRDGYRHREPDLSASAAVSAVVALPHGLLDSLVVLVLMGVLVAALLIVFGRTKDNLAGAAVAWKRHFEGSLRRFVFAMRHENFEYLFAY